jgi:hypothetical protein
VQKNQIFRANENASMKIVDNKRANENSSMKIVDNGRANEKKITLPSTTAG